MEINVVGSLHHIDMFVYSLAGIKEGMPVGTFLPANKEYGIVVDAKIQETRQTV